MKIHAKKILGVLAVTTACNITNLASAGQVVCDLCYRVNVDKLNENIEDLKALKNESNNALIDDILNSKVDKFSILKAYAIKELGKLRKKGKYINFNTYFNGKTDNFTGLMKRVENFFFKEDSNLESFENNVKEKVKSDISEKSVSLFLNLKDISYDPVKLKSAINKIIGIRYKDDNYELIDQDYRSEIFKFLQNNGIIETTLTDVYTNLTNPTKDENNLPKMLKALLNHKKSERIVLFSGDFSKLEEVNEKVNKFLEQNDKVIFYLGECESCTKAADPKDITLSLDINKNPDVVVSIENEKFWQKMPDSRFKEILDPSVHDCCACERNALINANTIKQFARVLKDGGKLKLRAIEDDSSILKYFTKDTQQKYKSYTVYTKKSLKKLLKN